MKYAQSFQRMLEYAAYDCAQRGHSEVAVDDLMLGLFREDYPLIDEVFSTFRVDSMVVLDRLLERRPPSAAPTAADAVSLGTDALRAIGQAEGEAARLGHGVLTPPHTLVGILTHEREQLQRWFIRNELVERREEQVLERVRSLVEWLRFSGGSGTDRDLEVLSGDTVVRMHSVRLQQPGSRRGRGYAVQLSLLKPLTGKG